MTALYSLAACMAWLTSGSEVWASGQAAPAPTPPTPLKPRAAFVDPSEPLLPDLQTLPPSDLHIERAGGSRRLLRLANLAWNSGLGTLELSGQLNTQTGKTQVHQNLYAPDGSMEAVLVGEFVFHITHAHWHIADFARYELWSLDDRGLPARVVVSGTKLSYCIIDTDRIDPANPSFRNERRYQGCDRVLQGMSPGWGDQYDSDLDGQSLDVTGLPDGVYALRSTANPDRWLRETDYTNNSATVYLALRGFEVEIVDPPWMKAELCEPRGWC